MPTFKKINTNLYKKADREVTPDNIYWKKLGVPVLVKEFGPIDYIDFSSVDPYHFAVTCSVRVQVYNPITKLVVKNLSRFRENAYGATFHADGRLICAGGEETNVKLFDVSTKSLLRLFKGHGAPVHRTFFVPNKPQIASFSDDKSVKIWDIPTEQVVTTYEGHSDYVRAGAVNPVVPDIVLSGGYDSLIKMYDSRLEKEVMSVNHGSPVEAMLFLPSGGIFLTAGGTDIKIWDTLAGGKLLGSMSQHHKTITCMQLASDNKRLLSGSLDRHVKIYELNTFSVVHTLDFPNSILSLGVSKDDSTVVAGLVDGLVSISRREQPEQQIKQANKKKITSFKYSVPDTVDTIVHETPIEKQAKYNHHLRKFEYSKALDAVLLPYIANKSPQVTVSVMRELIRRKALDKALSARESKSIMQIVKFLIRNICDTRFTKILISVTMVFLDVYQNQICSFPSDLVQLCVQLNKLLQDEIQLIDDLGCLHGVLNMLLGSQSTTMETNTDSARAAKLKLVPSMNAQKNLIVNLT